MRLAVIGAGYAGIAVLDNLVTERKVLSGLSIDMYDASGSFGRGLAYQDDVPTNILNRPVKMMYLSRRNDFREWLDRRQPDDPKVHDNAFLPRATFGDFLEDRLTVLQDQIHATGGTIQFLPEPVMRLDQMDAADGIYALQSASGRRVYDAVYICTGSNMSGDPYGLTGTPGYIASPYPAARLSQLRNTRVAILGCRLTAYDVALAINGTDMTMLSRSAELPRPVNNYRPVRLKYLAPEQIEAACRGRAHIGLVTVMDLFDRELHHHGIETSFAEILRGSDCRDGDLVSSILAATNMIVPLIWTRLSPRSRSLFMTQFHSLWSNMRVPIAQENSTRVGALLQSGALKHRKGLRNIWHEGGHYHLDFGESRQTVDVVVNATGIQRDVDETNPLITSLLGQGLARKDDAGGIQVRLKDCRVLNTKGQPMANLFALGQLTCGTFYMVNNIDIIHHQARSATAAVWGTQVRSAG